MEATLRTGGLPAPRAAKPFEGSGGADAAPREVLLFYKYVEVAEPAALAAAQRGLCAGLGLRGRVLVAPEGVNGTLSGAAAAVRGYVAAMRGDARFADVDFKFSTSVGHPFPNLLVREVKELVSSSGLFAGVPVPRAQYADVDAAGATGTHLGPEEFHALLQEVYRGREGAGAAEAEAGAEAGASTSAPTSASSTVILDIRNTKEYSIGHFQGAVDLGADTYSEIARYLTNRAEELRDKKVIMYCTGGIRCEKASAFLKARVQHDQVYQLQGGIHRYLEAFPDGGFFSGKNFVFDARLTQPVGEGVPETAADGSLPACRTVVGACVECKAPYDAMDWRKVCVVCHNICLVCEPCAERLRGEYHCKKHAHLKRLYFADLEKFSVSQLAAQREGLLKLERASHGVRRERKKRKTLRNQVAKIDAHLQARGQGPGEAEGGE